MERRNLRTLILQTLTTDQLEELLELLGIEIDRFDGREIKALCPFHVEEHPSFGIVANDEDEKFTVFYCYGCDKSGNIFNLIEELVEPEDAVGYLADFLGLSEELKEDERIGLVVKGRKQKTKKVIGRVEPKSQERVLRFLRKYCCEAEKNERVWDYLLGRGLSSNEIRSQGWLYAFKSTTQLLATEMKGRRAILPFGVKNHWSYFARLLPKKKGPKGLYPKGAGFRTQFLYPYPTDSMKIRKAYLVEGPFDAARLNRILSRETIHDEKAFSILGSSIAKGQIRLLRKMGVQEILTIPDNDAGGRVLLGSVRRAFKNSFWIPNKIGFTILPTNEDPDSCPERILYNRLFDPRFHLSLWDQSWIKIKEDYGKVLKKRKGLMR